MSKKIKAIKCPQCGSTKQKTVDEEHFQCLNCGTEYIIDSEEININHNYNYNNPTPKPIEIKTVGYILLAIIAVPFLMFLASTTFSSTNKTIKNAVVGTKYTWETANTTQVFEDAKGNLKMFIAGDVDLVAGSGRSEEVMGKLFWGIYDVASGKMEQINAFQGIQKEGEFSSSELALKKFDDGTIYYIIQKSKVYAYNIKANSLVNISNDLEQKIPQLKSGIGAVEFAYDLNALEITSNTGKKITYFPSTNLKLENFNQYNVPEATIKDATLQTKYAASRSNPNYVIQYKALAKVGYPILTNAQFNIRFDAKEGPIEAVADPSNNYAFIKSFKILNPESRLFKLEILDYNQTGVLIAFKTSIQEGEKYHIQYIDATGKIIWTYPTDATTLYESSLLTTKNEAFISSYKKYFWLDSKGKSKKNFKIEDITFDLN